MMPLLVPEISPLGLFVTRRRRTTEEELGFLVAGFKVQLYSGASSAAGKRGLDAKPRFAKFGIVNLRVASPNSQSKASYTIQI